MIAVPLFGMTLYLLTRRIRALERIHEEHHLGFLVSEAPLDESGTLVLLMI